MTATSSRKSPASTGAPYRGRILVVDDEPAQVMLASEILAPEGHSTETALSGQEALERLEEQPFDLVIADLMMPEMDGFELLRRIGDAWPDLPVIFLTGHAEVSGAVAAIKEGAENYVTKPFDIDRFRIAVSKALERKALRDDNARLRKQIWERRVSYGTLIGGSPLMQALYDEIDTVAAADSSILLLGESGTGKEMTAQEIHRRSKRLAGPFLAVNCGAIPADLLESELFGHVKGSFTGATGTKVGLFEAANEGTIFLDEIGSTTPATQMTLLRVLQEREVRRLGDTVSRPIDVRVISATNADVSMEMESGNFRSDLYFRLAGVVIRLPAVRQRQDDIPLLAEHFLAQACRRHGKKPHVLSARAMERLQRYAWPGNVREMENVLERAVLFAPKKIIGPRDLVLPEENSSSVLGVGDELKLDAIVRSHIMAVLKKCGGNKQG